MSRITSNLRVIWACTLKDIKSVWTERSTVLRTIFLPLDYLIVLSLFALSSSNAPTAVVMLDHGPYAQAFYQAMSHAHSFRLMTMSASQAHEHLLGGTIVAVVTIPANFDAAVTQRQALQIPVAINNLEEDLTDDVHRGMGLTITLFYAHSFPHVVTIVTEEHNAYSRDTEYIPFIALSIMVIGLMVTGILQAGTASAREWEKGTIKELLLAPTHMWAILVGKMLAIFVIGLPSIIVVLAIVVFVVGDVPTNLPMVVGVSMLTLLVFVAAGVALGMSLKERTTVTTINRALAVPLFILSGVFAPVSFSTPAVNVLARVFPVHYAVVLEQYAFKTFSTNTLAMWLNVLLLAGFGLVFLVLATSAMRWSKVPH